MLDYAYKALYVFICQERNEVTMTNDEERAYLLQELRWKRMKMNEAAANWQMAFHDLQVITQATIDHMEGQPDNDNAK